MTGGAAGLREALLPARGAAEQRHDDAAPRTEHAAPCSRRHVQPAQDTFWMCTVNLSKVITGAGMMALPRAFLQIGWLPGTAMLAGVAVLTFLCLAVLVVGAAETRAHTYAQLTRELCGPVLQRLLQLAILLFCFGNFGVVYLVVMRDILLGSSAAACDGLLCEAFGRGALLDPRLLVIGIAVLVCSPLLLMRSMERLAALNLLGVTATVLLALAALGLAALAAARGTAHSVSMLPRWQLLGPTRGAQLEALADVLPVILACYVAHQSLHPLMPLLQPYSRARMLKVVACALGISGGVFVALCWGATLAFGDATDADVLNNFSVESLQPLLGRRCAVLLSWLLRGGYLLCVLATLLLYFQPLRSSLAELLWPDPEPEPLLCPEPEHAHCLLHSPEAAPAAAGAADAPGGSAAQRPGSPTVAPEDLAEAGGAACCCESGDDACARASSAGEPPQRAPSFQPGGGRGGSGSSQPGWQTLLDANYYPLTYGLLAAMTLVAVSVRDIHAALSAIGDVACTMQAFIVPGALALALVARQWRARGAAKAAGGSGMPVAGTWCCAAGGGLVLVLGVALFINGVAARVADELL